jgi:hypothetical protein
MAASKGSFYPRLIPCSHAPTFTTSEKQRIKVLKQRISSLESSDKMGLFPLLPIAGVDDQRN